MAKRFKKIAIFFILSLFIIPFGGRAKKSADFHIAGLAVSDSNIGDQWYLNKIQAPDAWEITQGNENTVVAVIDTGIDLNHPDLSGNIWINADEIPGNGKDDDFNGFIDDINGWDFVDGDNSPEPDLSGEYTAVAVNHGTAVAGIIAAQGNNAFAGAGIDWHAKIMPLRVFSDKGESDTYLVEQAIQYAIDNGAGIINMSFVGFDFSASFDEKIKAAYDKGILLVAAAGNENGAHGNGNLDLEKSYPVCNDGGPGNNRVLGVAAVDMDDKKAPFSFYGVNCVDISAPGVKIYSAAYHNSSNADFNKYWNGGISGTSMAAPQVAGAAALVKSLHPNYTNKELTRVLLESADNIDGLNPYYAGRLGAGRLNVFKAVSYPAISMESEAEARVKYVLAAKAGEGPKIWFLDAKGDIAKEFYAFAPSFLGGVNLALGDVDGDGMVEVVAGAGKGGGPQIRIFDLSGNEESQFFAFSSGNRNGVKVAVGDINGDEKNEIVAVEAGNSKPMARIFDKDGKILAKDVEVFGSYLKNGVNLAAGDVDRDGKDEIIAGTASGALARIIAIDGGGKKIGEFFPYGKNFYGGVNVASGDLNNDGWADIITSKETGNSLIQEWNYTGRLLSPGFYAYDKYWGAVSVSAGDTNGDGSYEIIAAPGAGKLLGVKVWDGNFNLKTTLYPFGSDKMKSVNVFIITR